MDEGGSLGILGVILKVLLYLSTLGAAGICLVVITGVIERNASQKWLTRAIPLALAAVVFAIARLVLDALELGDLSIISMVWEMQSASIIAIGVGTLLLVIASRLRGLPQDINTALAALALSASFGLIGHTRGLEDPSFWPYLVAVHVVIASFWLVAPIVLWPRLLSDNAGLSARVKRFGEVAIWAPPVLFATGGFVAFRLGGGVTGLLTSDYGKALAVKLAAVLVVLALGAVNKLKVSRAFETDPAAARALLRMTLGLDTILFVIALIAIALATTLFGPAS